jgi:hypothetical protein
LTKLKSATDLGRKAQLIGLYEEISIPSISDKLDNINSSVGKSVDKATVAAKAMVRSVVNAVTEETKDIRGVLAVTAASFDRYDSLISLHRSYDKGSSKSYAASIQFRVIIFLAADVDIRELAFRLRREAMGTGFSASSVCRLDDEYMYDIDPMGLSIKIPDNAVKYMVLTFVESRAV